MLGSNNMILVSFAVNKIYIAYNQTSDYANYDEQLPL